MIIDALNQFCSETSLNTGAAGDYLIGDVIDLGAGRNIGNGPGGEQDLFLVVQVDADVTSAGAATVQFSLATDDNSAFASATKLAGSQVHGKAVLVAGFRAWAIKLPSSNAYERYIGLIQTTGTAALTAGKVTAFLTKTLQDWVAPADALSSAA